MYSLVSWMWSQPQHERQAQLTTESQTSVSPPLHRYASRHALCQDLEQLIPFMYIDKSKVTIKNKKLIDIEEIESRVKVILSRLKKAIPGFLEQEELANLKKHLEKLRNINNAIITGSLNLTERKRWLDAFLEEQKERLSQDEPVAQAKVLRRCERAFELSLRRLAGTAGGVPAKQQFYSDNSGGGRRYTFEPKQLLTLVPSNEEGTIVDQLTEEWHRTLRERFEDQNEEDGLRELKRGNVWLNDRRLTEKEKEDIPNTLRENVDHKYKEQLVRWMLSVGGHAVFSLPYNLIKSDILPSTFPHFCSGQGQRLISMKFSDGHIQWNTKENNTPVMEIFTTVRSISLFDGENLRFLHCNFNGDVVETEGERLKKDDPPMFTFSAVIGPANVIGHDQCDDILRAYIRPELTRIDFAWHANSPQLAIDRDNKLFQNNLCVIHDCRTQPTYSPSPLSINSPT